MIRRRSRLSQTTTDLLLLAIAALCVAAIYQHAADYYALDADRQLDHARYERWNSGGFIGKALGTAAVLMFLLNLAYLARRRLRSWHRWGILRHWMSAHVFFGLLGGGLLLLHANFRLTSPAARLSAQAVVALLATGVVGRYIYTMVPHTATGQEDPGGLRGRGLAVLDRLTDKLGADHGLIHALQVRAELTSPTGGLRGLGLLAIGWFLPLWRRWTVDRWLAATGDGLDAEDRLEVREDAIMTLRLGYELAVAGTASWILRRWRLVHLLAAAVMVWATWRHIDSAFRTGYGWHLTGSALPWLAGLLLALGGIAGYEWLWNRRYRRGHVKAKVDVGPPPEPPPTLHPHIDPARCIGSAACISACPEGDILGLLEHRARLAEPSHCIGHGACASNCPMEAITLVFGSYTRGVDIPDVSPTYESSVPGIYMAGELTGMGLIRNAALQAVQAVGFIAKSRAAEGKPSTPGTLDLLIIGAGPAGLAASLAAQDLGLNYLTLEQEPDVGGAIRHYPRRKLVMTAPMRLPLHGDVKYTNVLKEELISRFETIVADHKPRMMFGIRIETLEPLPGQPGFVLRGAGQSWQARRVLLCLGRRGTPMKLGVVGEDSANVIYNLLDPDVYAGRAVAVVGGGDSALEAAFSLAKSGASAVYLIHRRKQFDRAKAANRARLETLVSSGEVQVRYEAAVQQVDPTSLLLTSGEALPVTDVVVSIGGTLPTALLKAAGVQTQTHFGRPLLTKHA